MTDAELRRRVYLETANAIRFYLSSLWKQHNEDHLPQAVSDKLLESAVSFAAAADAIHESQQAGVE